MSRANSSRLFNTQTTHGHRRIAFIGGRSDDIAGDSGEPLAAYRAPMSEHGLALDQLLVPFGQDAYSGGQHAMCHFHDTAQPHRCEQLAANFRRQHGSGIPARVTKEPTSRPENWKHVFDLCRSWPRGQVS